MAKLSGASLRLGLLRDNGITQTDIVKNTGLNGAVVSLEIAGRGGRISKYRDIIYDYYIDIADDPVDVGVFWRK